MAFSRFKIQVIGNYRNFLLTMLSTEIILSKIIMEFVIYNVRDLQALNRKMALVWVLK